MILDIFLISIELIEYDTMLARLNNRPSLGRSNRIRSLRPQRTAIVIQAFVGEKSGATIQRPQMESPASLSKQSTRAEIDRSIDRLRVSKATWVKQTAMQRAEMLEACVEACIEVSQQLSADCARAKGSSDVGEEL